MRPKDKTQLSKCSQTGSGQVPLQVMWLSQTRPVLSVRRNRGSKFAINLPIRKAVIQPFISLKTLIIDEYVLGYFVR